VGVDYSLHLECRFDRFMKSRSCHQVSVGTFLKRDGQYLLLRRGNAWGIIGGWLEKSEDVYEGLLREISEEIQVDVEILTAIDSHTYVHPVDGPLISIIFISRYRSGQVRLSQEHEEFQWFSPEEIMSGKLLLGYPKEKEIFAKAFRFYTLYDH
jgi:8-oxo-dGTP pyrophosphatase MutT (NUDIX family)